MIGLKETFPELPGWIFEIDEVSVGVYLVKGESNDGKKVESKGGDPELLLEGCRQTAIKMSAAGQ